MRWGLGGVLLLAAVLRLDGLHWDAHRREEPGREASVPPYRWGSRVGVYTGLPTVLG